MQRVGIINNSTSFFPPTISCLLLPWYSATSSSRSTIGQSRSRCERRMSFLSGRFVCVAKRRHSAHNQVRLSSFTPASFQRVGLLFFPPLSLFVAYKRTRLDIQMQHRPSGRSTFHQPREGKNITKHEIKICVRQIIFIKMLPHEMHHHAVVHRLPAAQDAHGCNNSNHQAERERETFE